MFSSLVVPYTAAPWYRRRVSRSLRRTKPQPLAMLAVVMTRDGADAFSRSSRRLVSRNGEVVDLERHLVAVVGLGAPGDDEAGVVDEHVELRAAVEDLLGGGTHGVEMGEVGEDRFCADFSRDRPCALATARRRGPRLPG